MQAIWQEGPLGESVGHCTVYTCYVQARSKQGPLGGSVGHYILSASKMKAGVTGRKRETLHTRYKQDGSRATEWKRGTLHTRCKQDGRKGHWVKAWDIAQCTLVMCKQDGSRGHWVEAWDTTY